MFQSVVWGWAWRRLLEVGGWVGSVAGVVYAVYQGLDPAQQEVLSRLIGRGWEQVTLGDLKLLAPALALGTWGYVQSWRATREPQVVTRDGKKVPSEKLPPTTRAQVEIAAKKVTTEQPPPKPKLSFNPLEWFLSRG